MEAKCCPQDAGLTETVCLLIVKMAPLSDLPSITIDQAGTFLLACLDSHRFSHGVVRNSINALCAVFCASHSCSVTHHYLIAQSGCIMRVLRLQKVKRPAQARQNRWVSQHVWTRGWQVHSQPSLASLGSNCNIPLDPLTLTLTDALMLVMHDALPG